MTKTFLRIPAARLLSAAWVALGIGCSSSDQTANGGGDGPSTEVQKVCPPQCYDENPCTTDTCDANGRCHNDPLPNGSACNDGNACTTGDTCQGGLCTGQPVVCAASDQCHVAACDPGSGTCSNQAKPDGTSCNDGNACTQSDTCQLGVCTGESPVTCGAIDQCHVAGACNPIDGTCTHPSAADGTPCDDGNACTQADACAGGTCVSGAPVVCGALDQCHVAGVCDPSSGACSNPSAADGTVCNDGNACTQSDTCQMGVCIGAKPVTCSALDQCHLPGACDPANGACSNPAKPNGASCNDGNACTQTDTCQGGACTGANPVTCTALDQCHVPGACNPSNGQCSNPSAVDTTPCDDGNACTLLDTCQGGKCAGAVPVACPAPAPCHVAGTCNPSTGTCSTPNADDGTACDDGDACTTGEVCTAGACGGGAAVDCSDGNACTLDSCDPQLGCSSALFACPAAGAGCSGACTDAVNGCATYVCAYAVGCSQGYWKNHPESWVEYAPATPVHVPFDAIPTNLDDDLSQPTCMEALGFAGGPGLDGGARTLLRQAVAALLNAAALSPDFPLTEQEVIDEVNAALCQDRAAMLALAQELEEYNTAAGGGCPLN